MDYIPVNEPLLSGNELKYLRDCIETRWISSEGPFIREFEEKFAHKVERKFGIAVANGTAAIDIAVEALGIGPGNEVIMPTFTIISCITQLIRNGAVPVFVDSDPVTWNMDVSQIEKKITSRTKAIMVVHIYGLPVDMQPVLDLAEKYNLRLIEDAAEMHGQTYNDKPCGSFGDISTFSFYANKHITTGEGGMIVTNDEELAEKCRSFRNLCFKPQKRFIHDQLGWNYRLTNLQAALGLAQLEKLDFHVDKKRKIGVIYNELLKDIKYVHLPLPRNDHASNIYWVYGIVLGRELKINADEMIRRMADKNVGTRPFFYPMHLQPVFNNKGMFIKEKYPVAEYISAFGFYLPSGLAISEEQQIEVAKRFKEALLLNR